ncbi:MAG: hypothetical protein NC299_12720 [Lachnospiraceae bacterium]|nr:hypothetical protein [Ruminococcus sp.]MCM1276203.1 hypothetical protein [Lachnospiraceae bacterium]
MPSKSLTVGDVLDNINYLERVKATVDDAEKKKIDELIEKLKAMETRS